MMIFIFWVFIFFVLTILFSLLVYLKYKKVSHFDCSKKAIVFGTIYAIEITGILIIFSLLFNNHYNFY